MGCFGSKPASKYAVPEETPEETAGTRAEPGSEQSPVDEVDVLADSAGETKDALKNGPGDEPETETVPATTVPEGTEAAEPVTKTPPTSATKKVQKKVTPLAVPAVGETARVVAAKEAKDRLARIMAKSQMPSKKYLESIPSLPKKDPTNLDDREFDKDYALSSPQTSPRGEKRVGEPKANKEPKKNKPKPKKKPDFHAQ